MADRKFPASPKANGLRPSVAEVEAGARVLDREGRFHGWWPKTMASYDDLDSIGKDEFSAIVERILVAAAEARDA